MKRRFPWKTYHQRGKVETIFSVIKRMLGDSVMSRGIVTQNREMMYRLMAYNCYRINRNYVLILGVFYKAGTIDGSNTSLKALNSAIEIAQMSGAEITIFHVIPTIEESPKSRITAFEKQLEKQGQDILDDAAVIAKKQKVKFKTSLVRDSPGPAIVRLAKKGKFDHIVMSTAGTGSAEDDMLGSVSNFVVHKSEIPVYLIR